MLVLIEPTNCCNQKCKFCPTSDSKLLAEAGRTCDSLPEEMIGVLAEQLSEFPEKIKKVHLYKDGEPLLYLKLGRLISELKAAGVADELCLKTNGVLLSPEKNAMLVDSGLDWLGVSVAAMGSSAYERLTGVPIDFQKYIDNIKDFYGRRKSCHLYVKLANVSLTSEEIELFRSTFLPISDSCAIGNLHGWTSSEGRKFQLEQECDSYHGVAKQSKIVCPYPFYSLAVNANCDVSVCCSDWAHRTVVGNIRHERLTDIWNGERLREFRLMHLMGKRATNTACANCSYLEFLPDNIDEFRLEIAKKI